jgi:hypothetical protein
MPGTMRDLYDRAADLLEEYGPVEVFNAISAWYGSKWTNDPAKWYEIDRCRDLLVELRQGGLADRIRR